MQCYSRAIRGTLSSRGRISRQPLLLSRVATARAACHHPLVSPTRGFVLHEGKLDVGNARRLTPIAAAAPAAGTPPTDQQPHQKVGVLFVCLGNICRSPSAEAVFRAAVERNGLTDRFDIDSCGTGGGSDDWYTQGGFSNHEGNTADPRMTDAARRRGITLTSLSRPLVASDFRRFRYVVAMDAANVRAISTAAEHWRCASGTVAAARGPAGGVADIVPKDHKSQVSLMAAYCSTAEFKGQSTVPDPYYGGTQGFDLVLDLLDDACWGLLKELRTRHGL